MNIKFKSDYTALLSVNRSIENNIGITEQNIINFVGDAVPESKEDLLEILEEFISEEHYDLLHQEEGSEFTIDEFNQNNFEILNADEVYENFKYLIIETSCCDRASRHANYCPTCGKKLK